MTPNDITDLRAKAVAATAPDGSWYSQGSLHYKFSIEKDDAEFMTVCTPERVIELIEALKVAKEKATLEAEILAGAIDQANTLIAQRDALQAKLEEVTQDREEWKEATILANQRFKTAEAKLSEAQIEIEVRKGRMHDVAVHCATVEQERNALQKAIHYPDCWDTAAYPTIEDALQEMQAGFKCSNDDCAAPTQPEGDAERQERDVAHAHALFSNLRLHGEHSALKAAFSSLWPSAFSHGFQTAKEIYSAKAEMYEYLMDYRVHQIAPMFGVSFGNYTPELETIKLVTNAIDAARKGKL